VPSCPACHGCCRARRTARRRTEPASARPRSISLDELKGTRAVVGSLGVSQCTVERYVKDRIRGGCKNEKPAPALRRTLATGRL
jgi:hypothetical protein